MPSNGGGGGGKSGKDVRAGGAFFELFAKDNLSAVLDKIKKRALAFSGFMSKIGNAASIAGAGLAAPLVALFKGGSDRAAEVARMSAQFGVPIELMSKLQYAAQEAGVSVEEVMKDTEGRFSALVAAAPSIDPERAQQALETQREFAAATDALQQAMLPLLDTVTPLVKEIAGFVKENASAIRVLVPVAAALIGFGLAAKVVAISVTGLVLAVKGIGIALGLLLNPVGLVVAAFAGLSYLFLTQTEAGQGFASFIRTGLVGALDVLKDTFKGVSDALAKGDFALAAKVAFAGLKVVWLDLVQTLTATWVGFKMVFVDGWHDAVLAVSLVVNDLWTGFEKIFARIKATVQNAFGVMTEAALSFGILALEALDKANPTDVLKGSIAKLNALRDASVRARVDPTAAVEAADASGTGRADIIKADANRAQDERDKSRKDEIAASLIALAAARGDLAALLVEAARPKEAVAIAAPKLAKQFEVAESVKGTFSSNALGLQFGVSDKAKKQTELLQQLANGDGKLPDRIGAAVGLALSIR